MNSVLLDDQPDDLIDQYFVAAHVGLNQSKTALMVSSQLLIFIPYTTSYYYILLTDLLSTRNLGFRVLEVPWSNGLK